MDFREVKDSSRRFSRLFGSTFALVVAAWSFCLYVLLSLFLDFIDKKKYPNGWELQFELETLLLTLLFLALMLGASIRRLKLIFDGGSSFIATKLGGYPVGISEAGAPPRTAQREKALENIISEMAVASSISEPDVYVLPNEDGINAMAAGLTEDDVAIIVTRGALRRLDRDELSAVIAHEFSHILNGDMRRYTIMSGWLHGLFLLQILARKSLMRISRLQTASLAVALMILGALGYFAGHLILAAFCRRRETLADATAVQFTRNPGALAGALKKIGGYTKGSVVKSSAVGGLSHFFVAKPDKALLLSSHPPLQDRIWDLDPSWDGWYYDFEENPVDFLAENRPEPPKA